MCMFHLKNFYCQVEIKHFSPVKYEKLTENLSQIQYNGSCLYLEKKKILPKLKMKLACMKFDNILILYITISKIIMKSLQIVFKKF